MKRTRRAIAVALTVVALAVGLVVLTPVSAPGPTAPRVADAGIGYWSTGCNPYAEWFEYAGEHNWRLWTRNKAHPSYTTFVVIHALRRMYNGAGNECGALAELAGNEIGGTFWNPFCRCYSTGWKQATVFGELYWDRDHCGRSYVYDGRQGLWYGNQCWAA